jgi:hypothetical protein
MAENREPSSPDRREFLKRVGLAGLTTAVGAPAVALAQTAKTVSGMTSPAAPDTSKAAEAPKPPSDDAKALASVIQRRYGQHLDAAQMKDVTEEIDNRIEGGKRLRASKLANGDEPDFIFKP